MKRCLTGEAHAAAFGTTKFRFGGRRNTLPLVETERDSPEPFTKALTVAALIGSKELPAEATKKVMVYKVTGPDGVAGAAPSSAKAPRTVPVAWLTIPATLRHSLAAQYGPMKVFIELKSTLCAVRTVGSKLTVTS